MKAVFTKPLGAIALAMSLTFPVQAQQTGAAFGHELMTAEELQEHRATLRNMETEEERKAYRRAHHERMLERARERGVQLPEKAGKRGKGEGPRSIQGQRKGPPPGHGGGLK
jgi:hypothetical protein